MSFHMLKDLPMFDQRAEDAFYAARPALSKRVVNRGTALEYLRISGREASSDRLIVHLFPKQRFLYVSLRLPRNRRIRFTIPARPKFR